FPACCVRRALGFVRGVVAGGFASGRCSRHTHTHTHAAWGVRWVLCVVWSRVGSPAGGAVATHTHTRAGASLTMRMASACAKPIPCALLVAPLGPSRKHSRPAFHAAENAFLVLTLSRMLDRRPS